MDKARGDIDSKPLQGSFLKILLEDVMCAIDRLNSEATESHRRELIRSIFAAIEGNIWNYKEHVKSIAKTIDAVDAITLLAFDEKEYHIGDNGSLTIRSKYMPTKTMFRFASAIATKINADSEIDFGTVGWERLTQGYGIRDRITHPKSKKDLIITQADIDIVWSGCLWLIGVIAYSLETSYSYMDDLRNISQKLLDKDPEFLDLYEKATDNLSEE